MLALGQMTASRGAVVLLLPLPGDRPVLKKGHHISCREIGNSICAGTDQRTYLDITGECI